MTEEKTMTIATKEFTVTSKLIAFLNSAYRVPPEIQGVLLDKFDDLSERNSVNFRICVTYYLLKTEIAPGKHLGEMPYPELLKAAANMESRIKALMANEDDFQFVARNMLADAVLLAYC